MVDGVNVICSNCHYRPIARARSKVCDGERHQGRIQGGLGSQDPPPFGGPLNFIKREKTSCACARICHVLVVNSYSDPPFGNPVSAPRHSS